MSRDRKVIRLPVPPPPPLWLDGRALEVWRDVAKDLYERDILTDRSATVVAAYCMALEHAEGMDAAIAQSRDKLRDAVGETRKANARWEEVREFARELELPPPRRPRT